MGRAHTFFGECIREAAYGTIKLANAWYRGIPLVALGGYFWRDFLPPGRLADLWADLDERQAVIALAALTVAVSWLLFFVLRLVGAPARLYAAAQAQIRALAAEVDERRTAQESAPVKLKSVRTRTDQRRSSSASFAPGVRGSGT